MELQGVSGENDIRSFGTRMANARDPLTILSEFEEIHKKFQKA